MAEKNKLPENFSAEFQDNPARAFARAESQAIGRWQQTTYQEKRNMGLLNTLGRLFGGDEQNGAAGAGVPASPAPSSDGPATIELKVPGPPARLTTSTMTQEQLRQRRTNIIENASFGRPVHENVMLFVLKLWLLLGPFAFVLLTTSEVAYILTHLAAPGSGTLIIWGGALFIDLAMMFTTFGVALKRRDVAEKREAYGAVSKRAEADVWMGTVMWLVFAAINIISQSAFLLHIIQGSHDPNMSLLYLFVASRVTGFILGDATTAFFLAKVDNSAIKLIARAEREKAALYSDVAKAEGERQLVEAKAEAEISLIRIRVQQEQEDAQFLAELKRQVFTDILGRRSLPAPSEPTKLDGPRGARRLGQD